MEQVRLHLDPALGTEPVGLRVKRRIVSTLLCGLLGLSIAAGVPAADAPALILQHLTNAEGLPQGSVYKTLQDSQGFVWVATEDGLVRYDGRALKRYAYSPQQQQRAAGKLHL